jgi:hypothetical protein
MQDNIFLDGGESYWGRKGESRKKSALELKLNLFMSLPIQMKKIQEK